MLWVEGINFKSAGFDKLKDFFLTKSMIISLYKYIKKRFNYVKEIFIISTCNRTEAYYIANKSINFRNIIMSDKDISFYKYTDNDAIFHFAKVITGIDSQIIGETQITGQVKTAISFAMDYGYAGKAFNSLINFGVALNKYIRNNTDIGKGNSCYGNILINILKENFSQLNKIRAMVIGTGKLSDNICKYLSKNNIYTTIVSHKHFDVAKELAQRYNGIAIKYNDFPHSIRDNEVVVTATSSSHIILRKEYFVDIKKNIIVFDLTLQRNVEESVKRFAKLYTLSDFERKIKAMRNLKEQEKNKAIDIINKIVYYERDIHASSDRINSLGFRCEIQWKYS